MRYFYYGKEPESRERWEGSRNCCNTRRACARGSYGMMGEEGLVIEEDTIYEIDRECQSCRRNRQTCD